MYKNQYYIVFLVIISHLWCSNDNSIVLKNSKFKGDSVGLTLIVSKPIVFEDGILFTYASSEKKDVYLAGSFVGWQKKIKMIRGEYGVFYIFVRLKLKKGTYSYRFFSDGVWQNDPQQIFFLNDGNGTRISAFKLPINIVQYQSSPVKVSGSKFKFFLKNKNYKKVSWVGSRNSWDPYVDKMKLIDGYWVIVLRIEPDFIFYKFQVDGKSILDPENINISRLENGEDVSYVSIRKPGENLD
jgi:Glycogen recognition site of AMP-activated protein kinase